MKKKSIFIKKEFWKKSWKSLVCRVSIIKWEIMKVRKWEIYVYILLG